jgi:hypothetical protein
LRLKNFRLALLEAIIGLEIVLTRFLKAYLHVYKSTPVNRIDTFLSAKFPLTARLSGALDLTLDAGDLQAIDLNRVLTAVRWRNRVVHRTGHLPEGITDEEKTKVIVAVLDLVEKLARQELHISASPEMRAIADKIRERYQDLPFPSIYVLGQHRVLARFQDSLPRFNYELPARDRLEAAVADVVAQLSERDQRFKVERHLVVQFL